MGYTFALVESMNGVIFDACCSSFDTYLRIIRPDPDATHLRDEFVRCDGAESRGCQVAFNDDDPGGHCGLNSVLTVDASQIPPGDYWLIVEGYSSLEGEYQVVMRPGIEGNCDSRNATERALS